MLRFNAAPFLRLANQIGLDRGDFRNRPTEQATVVSDKDKESYRRSYETVLHDCIALGLDSPADQIHRIELAFERKIKFAELEHLEAELANRISDELARAVLLHIDSQAAKYFEVRNPFGQQVSDAFPDAILDIEEASSCLALGRDTASVLLLMRAMESLVHAVAKSVGIDYEFRGWDAVIRKIAKELEKSYPDMEPAFHHRKDFYSNVLDRLLAVKDSTRNPSMHGRLHYDHDRAEEVFRSVRSFAQKVAEVLLQPTEETKV